MNFHCTEIYPKCEMTEMKIYHDFIRGVFSRYLEISHCENCDYENREVKEIEFQRYEGT